jgi:hypothetical protein
MPGIGEITLNTERIDTGRNFTMKTVENRAEPCIHPEVTNTIDKIVDQLDVLTRTLVLLEQRVSKFEDHISYLNKTAKSIED